MPARADGQRWERRAEAWLNRRGLDTLDRNVNFRGGELDLVMRDGDAVVFVEVRARKKGAMVSAVESVGAVKQQRLLRAAQLYLARHPSLARSPCRFDVLAITSGGWRTRFDWIKQAFGA